MNEVERSAFIAKVRDRHGRVDHCFMTGKGCVYTDQIDLAIKQRAVRNDIKGFMIMPFRPRLKVFFENCLRPFFTTNYDPLRFDPEAEPRRPGTYVLERADDVARPGIIVCEGICKRIQESDFIVADISVPNDNVFYELGLAYGIGSKIVLVHQEKADFGRERAQYFRRGEGEHIAKQYQNLEMIERERFKVSEYIWRRDTATDPKTTDHPEVLFFEMMRDGGRDKGPGNTNADDDDIRLSFSEHVMSDMGLALNRIADELDSHRDGIPQEYLDGIIRPHLNRASVVDPGDDFNATRDRVDRSYCLVVRTGADCHPMAYFWLGYGHALGKNVIPITRLVEDDGEEAELARVRGGEPPSALELRRPGRGKVLDLAFDIRAQRHMTFDPQRPELLERQLEQTLTEMILADFSEWSRRRFWTTLLGSRGEVSIITGGLHSEDHNREMIGDWDLRAASALTSYFSRHQYRPKIETPIYQPEFARRFAPKMTTKEYIDQVIEEIKLGQKNCVVIASPDVNPLTEILLGRLFGVEAEELFSDTFIKKPPPNAAFIVHKKRRKAPDAESAGEGTHGRGKIGSEKQKEPPAPAWRAFYREEQGDGLAEQRGFRSRAFITGNEELLEYYGQNEYDKSRGPFKIYAQLLVARNPYTPADEPSRYVVILNGVSGPGTFALTQVLTGSTEDGEISDPGKPQRPTGVSESAPAPSAAAASESILNQFLQLLVKPEFQCIHSLIEVEVGADSTR